MFGLNSLENQAKAPGLYASLLAQIDLTDPDFQSPRFAQALKAARAGQFMKLEFFLELLGLTPGDIQDSTRSAVADLYQMV